MNKVVTHVAVGVVALGAGIGVGYFVGHKKALAEADTAIEVIKNYYKERLAELDEPVAIVTDEIGCSVPGHRPGIVDEENNRFWCPDCEAYFDLEVEPPIPSFEDQTKNLESVEPLPDDFPPAPTVVAEDFTVEGEAPAVNAEEFVKQYANRTVNDFGGVTFPGQVDEETLDAEPADIPVKSVPDFITVRDSNGPYVISIDEYMDPASDPPFTKVEMRWFAGDNVVVDIRDQIVPINTVGQQNTLRFGEGTTDPNQVYIRNERVEVDIELTREEGLYVHEVLQQGFEKKAKVQKFRESDDS